VILLSYSLALSFSNIHHRYRIPTVFIGYLFNRESEPFFNSVKTKNELGLNPLNYPSFNLEVIENELDKYEQLVVDSTIIKQDTPNYETAVEGQSLIDYVNAFANGYLKVIQIISARLTTSFKPIGSYYIHPILDINGKSLDIKKICPEHKILRYPLTYWAKELKNGFMNYTSLAATYEYLKERRPLKGFIYSQIPKEKNLWQVGEVFWRSQNIHLFSDSFVGYPDLILHNRSDYHKISLIPNGFFDVLPISPFCLGATSEFDEPEICIKSSDRHPFGLIPRKYDRCVACSKQTDHIRCLSREPRCDGISVKCKKTQFAGNVCNGDFALYITLFDGKIKVGRAILSRTIGRLLEQAAYDALVFYPIRTIKQAHNLEKKATEFLDSKVSLLQGLEIEKVEGQITYEARSEHIKNIVSERQSVVLARRDEIYKEIKKLIENSEDKQMKYLSALESKKVDLSSNWCYSEPNIIQKAILEKNIQLNHIKGIISSVIGPFIIINEKMYNLHDFQGFVVQCQ
jgi:hypothetical protein